MAGAVVAVLLAVLASLLLGVQDLAPGAVLDAVRGARTEGETAAIVSSRIDRTVIGLVVGASVALSGVVLQGLTRNPIAEPGILGLNSGAALAVVLGISFLGLTTVTGYAVAALVGTLVVATLVQALTAMAPRSGAPVAMALAGAAVMALAQSLIGGVLVTDRGALDSFRFWQVGSVAGREASSVVEVLPFLVVGALLALTAGPTLNAVALGDDLARGLGQNVVLHRGLAAGGAVLLAAGATALAGPIAFVGLVVPHVVRAAVGVDHRRLLVLSALPRSRLRRPRRRRRQAGLAPVRGAGRHRVRRHRRAGARRGRPSRAGAVMSATLVRPPATPDARRDGTSTTADALARARRRPRRRRAVVVGVLVLLLLGLVVVRALLGDYRVSFPDAIRIIGGEQIPGASFVLMESTLPRALMAVLAGAAFGAAGCAFQVMLRNPLASPDVLGITLGASAGAVIAVVVLGVRGTPVTVAALTGAVLAAGLILSQAGGRGGATGRMVLIGVALAAGLSAVVHWVLVRASIYQAQDALIWLSGSLNTVTWADILRMLVLDAMLLPLLLVLAGRLPVLGLGDDLAAGLGVRVGGLRVGVTVVVVTLVAAATAVVGPIAFVGFLSGPIARRLVPGRPAVGVAALVGAVVVLAADYLAAYGIPGTALPVGVVTGALGAPVLLWMLRSRPTTQEGR